MRKVMIPLTNQKTLVFTLPGETIEVYVSDGTSSHYIGTATWRSAWNGLRGLFLVRGGPQKG